MFIMGTALFFVTATLIVILLIMAAIIGLIVAIIPASGMLPVFIATSWVYTIMMIGSGRL